MVKQSKPLLEKSDFDYIDEILRSGHIAKGCFVDALQNEFIKTVNMGYAFATSSGTSALHLSLLSLGVGEGDEVIIPSYTCSALLNAVYYVGARPVLVDIDPETFNATTETIKFRLSRNTKAIIVTHAFGFPADLDEIFEIGVPVIEDCAHAIGSTYKGCPAGSKGIVSVFSLYATKMITSGEGGMICTSDEKIANAIQELVAYDNQDIYKTRYNYKMSDLAAGLALSQIKKLALFVSRRKEIAARYLDSFSCLPLRFQKALSETVPSYYRFVILTSMAKDFMEFLQGKEIMCDRPVYKPLHYYFNKSGQDNFKGTNVVWDTAVSIPIYPTLSDEEVSLIIETVSEFFRIRKG